VALAARGDLSPPPPEGVEGAVRWESERPECYAIHASWPEVQWHFLRVPSRETGRGSNPGHLEEWGVVSDPAPGKIAGGTGANTEPSGEAKMATSPKTRPAGDSRSVAWQIEGKNSLAAARLLPVHGHSTPARHADKKLGWRKQDRRAQEGLDSTAIRTLGAASHSLGKKGWDVQRRCAAGLALQADFKIALKRGNVKPSSVCLVAGTWGMRLPAADAFFGVVSDMRRARPPPLRWPPGPPQAREAGDRVRRGHWVRGIPANPLAVTTCREIRPLCACTVLCSPADMSAPLSLRFASPF